MANWQQETVMAEERERGQRKALNQPFGMLARSVSSDSEQAKFAYSGAKDRQITVTHPFNSATSWIRAMPEEGTTYVGVFRSDEAKPQPLVTVTRNSLERNDQYRKGANVYRPLFPGEIEVSSTGYGQAFFTRRAKAELRGGMIHRWMDQDKLISGDIAPIHQRQLLQYRSNELGEEERLGIIARPKKLTTGDYSTWELSYPQVEGDYTAEQYISLMNPSNQNPAILFTSQRGHVLDKDGVQIKQSRTQIPLRYFEEYFAKDESSTRSEIDEKGNWYFELADAATEGYELNVPNGNYVRDISGDETILIGKNTEYSVGASATYQIGANWNITTEQDYILSSTTGQMNFIMKSADPSQMVLNTRNHFIILDDTSGEESISILHNTGSQVNLDGTGSVKIVGKDGSMAFFDADTNTISATSSKGSFVSLNEAVVISDSSGGQILNFDGTDTIQISAQTAINIMAQQITIGGGAINLGSVAALSAVLAEPLALLFDAHIHASPTGPTSPPLPPNTAALMNASPATSFASLYVKVRSNLAG